VQLGVWVGRWWKDGGLECSGSNEDTEVLMLLLRMRAFCAMTTEAWQE
jgi:hypothetical protein